MISRPRTGPSPSCRPGPGPGGSPANASTTWRAPRRPPRCNCNAWLHGPLQRSAHLVLQGISPTGSLKDTDKSICVSPSKEMELPEAQIDRTASSGLTHKGYVSIKDPTAKRGRPHAAKPRRLAPWDRCLK